ncbi:transposase [Pedobacter mendelii]|uniref:transposase n=1 Tax=Pedobacter mendelii TaxID=1908240 RepID=UPI00361001DF
MPACGRQVFVRPLYNDVLVDSLKYSITNLGLQLFCWCIMPSHVHLIFKAKDNNPDKILGRIKEHTSKALVKAIKENSQELERNGCFGYLSGQDLKVVM